MEELGPCAGGLIARSRFIVGGLADRLPFVSSALPVPLTLRPAGPSTAPDYASRPLLFPRYPHRHVAGGPPPDIVREPSYLLPPLQPLRLARYLSEGPIVACSVAPAEALVTRVQQNKPISDPQLRPCRAVITPVPGGIRLATLVSRPGSPPPPPSPRGVTAAARLTGPG